MPLRKSRSASVSSQAFPTFLLLSFGRSLAPSGCLTPEAGAESAAHLDLDSYPTYFVFYLC